MRNLLKKFSIPILIIFWSYTWHAYAIGAVGQKVFLQESQKTVLKEQSPHTTLLSSIQNKLQFKKRPFIAKGDTIVLEPSHLNQPVSSVEYIAPLRNLVFESSSKINYLLRSPPSLS